MAAIKNLAASAEKWRRSTEGREQDYTEGIRNPRRSWADATLAAEASYKAGVIKAANEGRFGRGVQAAGDTKWRDKTLAKGATRWAEGISLSGSDYERGFKPYHDVIANIQLTPRVERGNVANLVRVKEISQALHAKKVELAAGR